MDIANLVQTVGIPFAVSLGLGYAGWCGAIWIGQQVVVVPPVEQNLVA